MELILEKNNIRVYENDSENKHRFFVVAWDGAQVTSIVPSDFPVSGTWFANGCSTKAIGYVAGGRTRRNALAWLRALTR